LIRYLVLMAFVIVFANPPTWSWIYVPFIIIVQFAFGTALVVWLSTIGTFIRDVSRVVPVVIQIWWYMSPGLYGYERVPARLRWIFDLNPFAYIIGAYKAALLEGKVIYVRELVMVLLASALITALGIQVLQRTRYFFFRYI
jgi:ABC-type polysaccharide/polyol phosphate export permease